MIEGQMNIFDFIKPKEDINDLTEAEMVRIVSDATGIPFVYKDDLWGWMYEDKNGRYCIGYRNYAGCHNNERFISCSWDTKTEGCGHPMGSVRGAIDFFKKYWRVKT